MKEKPNVLKVTSQNLRVYDSQTSNNGNPEFNLVLTGKQTSDLPQIKGERITLSL